MKKLRDMAATREREPSSFIEPGEPGFGTSCICNIAEEASGHLGTCPARPKAAPNAGSAEALALEWLVDHGGDESEYSVGVVADLIDRVRRKERQRIVTHLRETGGKWNDHPVTVSAAAREHERFAGRMLLVLANEVEAEPDPERIHPLEDGPRPSATEDEREACARIVEAYGRANISEILSAAMMASHLAHQIRIRRTADSSCAPNNCGFQGHWSPATDRLPVAFPELESSEVPKGSKT